MRNIASIYLLAIVVTSLISIIITVYDKLAAKRKKRRISEKALMLTGIFGGASVMFMTMIVIRHKTKHMKFMVSLPLMSALHIAILAYPYSNIS